ncbi:hypothetical protein Tco_1182010 [Tanacetum coccineum]
MTEEEETQASRKTKEQILQEEAGLAEAIRLDALEKALEKEEVAKQVHLDSLIAQKMAEEQELTEEQKKRKAQDLTVEYYAKRMVELVNQRRKHFAEERARAKRNKPMAQTQLRNYMSNFLKNQGTWKLTQLKKLNFEEVKAEFEKLIARKGFHTHHDKDESEDSDEANEKDDSTSRVLNFPINPVSYGTDMVYISFGAMLTDISRDDLTELYRIVMRKHGINKPEDEFEKVLWEYLKNMFEEPLSTDSIWSLPVCKAMLDKKLQGGKPDDDCYKLLKMMEKQAGIRKHKDWLVQEQTALGKDFSNPLMADNLPKIIWLSTHHIWMYAKVFGLDVPLTQSQPTESTQGTHRTPSAPRSPTPKTDTAELEPRSDKESPKVESTNDEQVEIINVVIPVNVNEEEDEITDEVYELKRREKGKIIEESRSTPFPTPIRSSRTYTNLVSLNTEKLQELTVTDTQTTSSSRSQHTKLSRANRLLSLFISKPAQFKRYKNFFQELQGRYTYLFEHLKQRFLSRKLFDTLVDHLQEVMVESLPIMVDTHIKKQVKKQVPEQVRDQVLVYVAEGMILERQKTKEEMERMIAKAILQERMNIQAEISSQIQKAIDNQIPSQVDASVQSYMSGHILHVHPAKTQTLFVQEQLYLSMKDNPQLQQQDIALWLALQMKFENLQVPQTTCRPSAVCPRDQDDPHDDAHPHGENSAKRQKTSKYEAYVSGESSSGQVNEEERGPSTSGNQEQEDDYDFWTDSYASDDDEIPSKQVSQDIMKEVSLIIDEAKLKKMADEMLRQRCTSGDEHQYHTDQMKNFLKSDIVWENRKEILVYPHPQKTTPLKGSSGPKKIVLSLHKFPAIIFNDDDIEERTSRWVNKCVKKFNPYGVEHWKNPHAKIFYIRKQKESGKPKEEVYSISKIIQVIKTYWELGHEHKFITEIIERRANECIVSITEPNYKNLNKNNIEDMYLLIMNGKVPDYAETGLLWSLSVFIRSSVIWERVHDFQLGIESYQQKVNLTAPTISFPGVEKYKMFSIIYEPVHGIIYKNSKKEKRVMRHSEIHKFCDATLNRVLEGLKSYNNDVKYGYVQRELTNDEVEYLKLFEEEIEVRLKYRNQMRRWEMYVNGRPLGPRRERPE